MTQQDYQQEATALHNHLQEIYKKQAKRAKIIAVILASATVISLIFLVYAFIQKGVADRTMNEMHMIKQQLEKCQQLNNDLLKRVR